MKSKYEYFTDGKDVWRVRPETEQYAQIYFRTEKRWYTVCADYKWFVKVVNNGYKINGVEITYKKATPEDLLLFFL